MFTLTIILALLLLPMPLSGALPASSQNAVVAPFEIEGEAVTGFAVEPVSGEALYVSTEAAIYRMDEHGAWIATGTPPGLAHMVADTRSPSVAWAGTGQDCYRDGAGPVAMVTTSDSGATWVDVGPTGYVPLASWVDLGVVIAHDCSGLQISRDGGETWAMPEGLPLGSQVTSFAVASSPESAEGLSLLVGVTGEGGTSQLYRVSLSDPSVAVVDGPLQTWYAIGALEVQHDGTILVGAPQGVLRSTDRGETWTVLRDGLETTTLEQDPIEWFPPDLEPGSFGLHSILEVDGDVYVGGVDGMYRLGAEGQSWELVAGLEVEIQAMAIEPGTGALILSTGEGEILRADVQAGT